MFHRPVILIFALSLILPACVKKNLGLSSRIDFLSDFPGYQKSYGPDFYDTETIFDYIDGGADVYLQRGFVNVMSFELETIGEAGDKYRVDIYDMGKESGARAIFEKERSGNEQKIEGTEGSALSENQLQYWKSKYYVKVTSYGTPKESKLVHISGIILKKID